MKKLLFLLLAAAAVTACDNDEERNGKQSAVYDGMLIVTNKTQIPNIETISKNVRYELTESTDGTITPIVPYIGSTPYPDYRITDFYGEMPPETLSIRFNCSADITLPNGGKLILDHDTKYTGTLVK